jgi:hypothetical protein
MHITDPASRETIVLRNPIIVGSHQKPLNITDRDLKDEAWPTCTAAKGENP